MRSSADDTATLIAAAGLGVIGSSSGWSINIGTEPDSPASCITVYDTPGLAPDTDELDLHRPEIQVRVRSNNYRSGYSKQDAIRSLLIAIERTMMNGSRYFSITPLSDVFSLGKDENDLHVLACNYRVLRQKV